MSKQHKLEILLAWLEDNVEMETDILFTDGVDSAAMIPVVRGAVELLGMPKAKRCDPPWQGYHHVSDVIEEMNRDEAQIWNQSRNYVLGKLKGVAV
ncbi:TPA: hypothetical protein ACGB3K_005163 [Klebsiella aerogenes]